MCELDYLEVEFQAIFLHLIKTPHYLKDWDICELNSDLLL